MGQQAICNESEPYEWLDKSSRGEQYQVLQTQIQLITINRLLQMINYKNTNTQIQIKKCKYKNTIYE